jgi:hypothetical protein
MFLGTLLWRAGHTPLSEILRVGAAGRTVLCASVRRPDASDAHNELLFGINALLKRTQIRQSESVFPAFLPAFLPASWTRSVDQSGADW